MVSAEDAASICKELLAKGFQLWLTGGWGIDALVGRQTRPHKDLDVIALADDVAAMREFLAHRGFDLKELWSENRCVVDAHGAEISTAFVLNDSQDREIDIHAMRLDDRGMGIPAWEEEGRIFEPQDLSGIGMIAGLAVQCLSPEMQMSCHSGYELPAWQIPDLDLLNREFGVEYPDELSGKLGSA